MDALLDRLQVLEHLVTLDHDHFDALKDRFIFELWSQLITGCVLFSKVYMSGLIEHETF